MFPAPIHVPADYTSPGLTERRTIETRKEIRSLSQELTANRQAGRADIYREDHSGWVLEAAGEFPSDHTALPASTRRSISGSLGFASHEPISSSIMHLLVFKPVYWSTERSQLRHHRVSDHNLQRRQEIEVLVRRATNLDRLSPEHEIGRPDHAEAGP